MLLNKTNISSIIKRVCMRSSLIMTSSSQYLQKINNFQSSFNTNHKSFPINCNQQIKYSFTQRGKTSQLILYSQQQLQNLHISNQKNRQKGSKDPKNWQVYKQKTDKFKVSLVGLPNCGKSSLFNCIIGQRLAIVDKQYGMTRDRRQYTILDGMVSIIDTPGVQVNLLSSSSSNRANKSDTINQSNKKQLKQDIFQQTLNAIDQSDMVLLVIDAKKQTVSEDEIILAKYLKAFNSNNGSQNGKKCQIVILCNKCDGVKWDQFHMQNELYSKLPLLLSQKKNNKNTKHQLNTKEQTEQTKQNNSNSKEKQNGNKMQNQLKQQNGSKIFFCSAEQGTGIFQVLQHINKRIPQQLKQNFQKLRKQRRQKFQKLVKKLKQQIKQINQNIDNQEKQTQRKEEEQKLKTKSSKQQETSQTQSPRPKKNIKRFKIKQWQKDFRSLNPNPQQNDQLDNENYQDLFIRPEQTFSKNTRGVDIKNIKMKNSIKICFIGRPNVGKSSLINELLGQQKMVVSEVAHTTRDSLTTKLLYKNRKIQLVDTAGLNTPRFQQNQQQFLRKAQMSTMLHVQQSHVVVYVMDAFSAFKVDDFKIINQVIKQGRPVLIVVNKWQAIKQQYRNKAKNYLFSQIDKNLGQLHGHPVVFVSAKMLLNIDQMMDQIINIYDKWNKRISTGLLNNWLEKFKKLDNLPRDQQRTLKINYVIQAKVRPPHFILFVNNKQIFLDHYMRFLMRNMAEQFDLKDIPIRHSLRSTNNKENQFKKKKQKKQKKQGKARVKRQSQTKQRMEQLKKKYGDFTI